MNVTIQGVDITLTEEQLKQLQSKLNPKEVARQFLLDILSKPFEVNITKGFIVYSQDERWLFQQDLKNKTLCASYYGIWEVLEEVYKMKYNDIQALIKETVGEALNCKEFTPGYLSWKRL